MTRSRASWRSLTSNPGATKNICTGFAYDDESKSRT